MAAKTPRERGFGQWLIEQRTQRGWRTAEMARREMLRLGGIKVDKSTYASYESGAIRPRPERVREFTAFYGSEPPSENGSGEGTDLTALVVELRENTKAIRELIGWLGPLAAAGIAQGVAQAAEEARDAGGTPDEPPPPPQP